MGTNVWAGECGELIESRSGFSGVIAVADNTTATPATCCE
jgi:hypothetical protein